MRMRAVQVMIFCLALVATNVWANEPAAEDAKSPVFMDGLQSESSPYYAYTMTTIEGECRPACAEDEVCREGKCMKAERVQRLNLSKVYCDPLRYNKVDDVCVLREDAAPVNVAGAWALEFFIGFGAGGYYAKNTGLGVAGTVFSIMFYSGMAIVIKNDLDGAAMSKDKGPFGMGFMALGIMGRLVTIGAVPVLASSYNQEVYAAQQGGQQSFLVPPVETSDDEDDGKGVAFRPSAGGFTLSW